MSDPNHAILEAPGGGYVRNISEGRRVDTSDNSVLPVVTYTMPNGGITRGYPDKFLEIVDSTAASPEDRQKASKILEAIDVYRDNRSVRASQGLPPEVMSFERPASLTAATPASNLSQPENNSALSAPAPGI